MTIPKPLLFVGSSSERLSIVRTAVQTLGQVADVVPWTDSTRFRRPGEFFLQSLLRAADSFDYAVLVFGPDDIEKSRGRLMKVTRDNVIFECGLFMSRLGHERTFILAPPPWKTRLKILTDLQNLNLTEYQTRAGRPLRASLTAACNQIADAIEADHLSSGRGPHGVTDIRKSLMERIGKARQRNKRVGILNVALDLEVTWPIVRDNVLADSGVRNVRWRSLMIDVEAREIQEITRRSPTVSPRVARRAERDLVAFCNEHSRRMRARRIDVEFRAYRTLPPLHGFLIGDDSLFFSVCDMQGDILIGSPNPYLEFIGPRANDKVAVHFLEAFRGWFDYHWRRSRRVWPA